MVLDTASGPDYSGGMTIILGYYIIQSFAEPDLYRVMRQTLVDGVLEDTPQTGWKPLNVARTVMIAMNRNVYRV